MMRSRIALAPLAAAALLLAAPAVRAQDSGSAAWNGSTLNAPASSSDGFVHVNAYFTRSGSRVVDITIHTSGSVPGGCSVPGPAAGFGRTPTSFAADLTFNCNGSYNLTAVASTKDDSALLSHDEATRTAVVQVSMPAPEVTGLRASGGGRSITLSWDDLRGAAPDLSGYVIERRIGSGSYEKVTDLSSDATSFTDEDLPTDAGEATYRVSSVRPSPSGAQVSAASDTGATPFTAAPTPPPGDGGTGDGTTGDGTTGDGTTGDGTTPGGGTGDGTTPGSTPGDGGTGTGTTTPGGGAGVGGRPSGGGVRAPRLGITGTFLPPLLRPSASLGPPTTVDGGFSDRLPYDDVEPGEDDPVLPDDELASIFSDDEAGRGMAIPIATALVLAVWAFHLRFLARASQPTQ